jgi:hypothetical protein
VQGSVVNAMKRLALTIAMLGLLGAMPAFAGGPNASEIQRVATFRAIDKVVIVDTATNDRFIWSKRAMTARQPLTALQMAIWNNRVLMAHIRANVWTFDLKSVYAVHLGSDGVVVIYLGEPPSPT